MSDIALVIKVDEEIYQEAIKSGYSHLYDEEVANAIANGIPLDKITKEIEEIYANIDDVCIKNGLNLARRTINKYKTERSNKE